MTTISEFEQEMMQRIADIQAGTDRELIGVAYGKKIFVSHTPKHEVQSVHDIMNFDGDELVVSPLTSGKIASWLTGPFTLEQQ